MSVNAERRAIAMEIVLQQDTLNRWTDGVLMPTLIRSPVSPVNTQYGMIGYLDHGMGMCFMAVKYRAAVMALSLGGW